MLEIGKIRERIDTAPDRANWVMPQGEHARDAVVYAD
jgi:hypothetical protein